MKKFNALLLSDDINNISRFVNVLKINFHQVSVSNNRSTLSEIFTTPKPKPNLVVIDTLSIKDSPELIRTIKKQFNLNICPVIVITEKEISNEGVAYLREGASDYISYKVSDEEFYLRASNQLDLIQFNNSAQVNNSEEYEVSQFDSIFPIEDRSILLSCERYMKHHMNGIKNVADLSIAVALSERKLNELFKLHTQMSTAEFLRNEKIAKAKELLSTTRMTMSEIAAVVGYSSAANFATAFKQTEGVSPKEYRAQADPRILRHKNY